MASPEATPERLSPTLKSDASSSRSGSPDSDCPICLGKVNNKAFTDACFHTFCFVCLLEWSKIKATCPLCKTTFKSIIHNVVSNDVYDQYHLKPTDSGSFGTDRRGRRFRYSTTMTEEHRTELTWRRNRALGRRYQRSYQIHLQAASEERRRLIYRANLWARHMGSNPYTLYRDISTEFFRRNPAITHRLVPWLRRDLGVLFTGEDHVTFMTQYIMSLLPNVHLQTEEFHEHLRPFLYAQTDHFIHELVSFARSPYDMNTYDQIAQYDFTASQQTNQTASQLPLTGLQGSSDYNDVISLSSEDEVIEVPTLSSLLGSDSTSSNTSRAASEQVEALDLSSTHNPEPPSIQPDPYQAGPSGFFSNPPVDVKIEPTSIPSRMIPSIITDDDSDIEIVGVLKPYEERTPECVILVSSSTEEEHTDLRQTKQGGKRHQKKKHIQDPEGSSEHQGTSKQRSQSVENDQEEHNHRHSNKRKHKDRRHHRKHRDSSSSSKTTSSHPNHAENHQERSSHSHLRKPRSRSRSKSKGSASFLPTFRELDRDRSREQSNSRKDSSSSSHGSHSRGSSKHKSEFKVFSTVSAINGHSQEAYGVGRGSHHREMLSDDRECWELLWRNRNQKDVASRYANHSENTSRREAFRDERTHSHHHDASISRQPKHSDSENSRERTKGRRVEDSKKSLLPLTMVLSRKKRTISDRYEQSSSSTDVLAVSSSHSRHKHKKHKKHKRHKSKEDRKQHSVNDHQSHTDKVYVQEDTANDGDESSTSTEEDFGSRQPYDFI